MLRSLQSLDADEFPTSEFPQDPDPLTHDNLFGPVATLPFEEFLTAIHKRLSVAMRNTLRGSIDFAWQEMCKNSGDMGLIENEFIVEAKKASLLSRVMPIHSLQEC